MIRLTERRADTIYGLSEKSVEFRNWWKTILGLGLFLGLSLISSVISFNSFNTTIQKLALLGMSVIKYMPLLWVIYTTSKAKAAQYLDDIYELEDIALADRFIENVAFGGGDEKITINEGKISEEDEKSPIILIGGPGYIKVNLGSAALLEQIDGSWRVISASKEPWKLNSFERIREIGEEDQVGKREYATINLQDQFATISDVKSRSKDGIPIEAHDIKIMFSIVREPNSKDPYSFDRNAVRDLVYKQTLISPKQDKNNGILFPWDMAVIPLIKDEMEQLISSKALSEILSSISQKELDQITENESGNTEMRVEITGQMTQTPSFGRLKLRNFETRSQITDRFFEKEFIKKASEAGITLHWIDVGTWRLPNNMILDNIKSAWVLAQENKKAKREIEGSAKKRELEKLIELIQSTIIDTFESTTSKSVEYDEQVAFLRLLEKAQQSDAKQSGRHRTPEPKEKRQKSANAKAIEVLRAFLRELLAAADLIQKENISPIIKEQELYRINRVIDYIQEFVPVKGSK